MQPGGSQLRDARALPLGYPNSRVGALSGRAQLLVEWKTIVCFEPLAAGLWPNATRDAEEHRHLPELGTVDVSQRARPRGDDHGLNVEGQEPHRGHSELDAEAAAGHVGQRPVAGLVDIESPRVRRARADEVRHSDGTRRECCCGHTEQQEVQELVDRRGPVGA